MELKSYQRQVLRDLNSYMSLLNETESIIEAYNRHWFDKGIKVGLGGMPIYKDTIKETPHICFKVPTGGGKTFLACASVRCIFDNMPMNKTHVVVWLVPSNAILEQTIATLSNTDHPYRQRLDRDFSGRVMVYTKDQLLNGQNFNPTAVQEQLSICILSYDSLRSNKKDGRKVYQENGQLAQFASFYPTPDTLINDVDDSALIQVLNQMSPVVIVDESHNAKSDLSVEMLQNLNPSFVLDLTATPKDNSNIISIVDARALKKENMVKLPVIVYNRNNKTDVISDAIHLRASIEKQAITEKENGGSYIRPIVLFQAQPKNKEDSETFDKIKNMLIDMGIPADEVAIKTSNKNELKGINLLSEDCKIRYIITVNALKEGWDCSFAYILATLANKTSVVDVEQIVGRILRQPYARQNKSSLLNASYVLTCSNDFRDTLDNVVKGLNNAGFSRDDMRVATEIEPVETLPQAEPPDLFEPKKDDVTADVDVEKVRETIVSLGNETPSVENQSIKTILDDAAKQSTDYTDAVNKSEDDEIFGSSLAQYTDIFSMQEQFKKEALALEIPQFAIKTAPSLFGGNTKILEKENLTDGFSLNEQPVKIKFDLSTGEMYKVDISESGQVTPKYQKLSKKEGDFIRDKLESLPVEGKNKFCTKQLAYQINKSDQLGTDEVTKYVDRIVSQMTNDELSALETSIPLYARKIQEEIGKFEALYREKKFGEMLDSGEIICQDSYRLPKEINFADSIDTIEKSLYTAEASMNDFEHHVINAVISLDNINWWHRIIERKGFRLNGFINHYPDFMVMTKSGVLVLIETKGDYLDNEDSRQKRRLGRKWEAKAGNKYRYFMVFKNKDANDDGAYTLDEFINIMKKL